MGWQVLYLNKLDLSKQHRDSSLSAGASTELRGIRDILRKVREWFLIPLCRRSFWFKEKNTTCVRCHSDKDKLVYVNVFMQTIRPHYSHVSYTFWINCTNGNTAQKRTDRTGLAGISVNEHAYTTASLRLDGIEPEEWKEGNFLPVVCGTESSAVVPVLSFSSDIRGKSKVSDGNDTGAAHIGDTSGL